MDKPTLELVTNDKGKTPMPPRTTPPAKTTRMTTDLSSGKDKRAVFDPIRNEALNILTDFVELNRAPRTASVSK